MSLRLWGALPLVVLTGSGCFLLAQGAAVVVCDGTDVNCVGEDVPGSATSSSGGGEVTSSSATSSGGAGSGASSGGVSSSVSSGNAGSAGVVGVASSSSSSSGGAQVGSAAASSSSTASASSSSGGTASLPASSSGPASASSGASSAPGSSTSVGPGSSSAAASSSSAGPCADTETNARHCGACGHDCGGGDCVLGICQPFEWLGSQSLVNHLASDPVANTVFWTRGGSAGGVFGRHVSGAGGTVTYLSATPAWALSLDVNHIAWSTSVDESTASSYTGDAGRTALDSPGSPSVIASGVDHPRAVANAGSNFFWAEFTNGKVYRAPAVGLNVSAPSALAVTADGFWVLNSGGTLYRTNLNYAGGTTPGAVHTSAVAGPTSLALGTLGRKVFFSDGEGLYQYDGETGAELVLTADYEPGAVTKNHVFAIAAHDGWVYYTTNQIGGNARGSRLFRVQMDVEQQTARPVVLAPGQDARGLTVVGDFIYWANVTGSAIMAVRIPLPPGSGE